MTTRPTRKLPLSCIFILLPLYTFCEQIDSTSIKLQPRLSFYSYEKNGEYLLKIPETLLQKNISVNIMIGKDTVATWKGKAGKRILRVPFPLNFSPATYASDAKIISTATPGVIYKTKTKLMVLPYKPNEVKTDLLTGGLVVNRLPFFPFGFYCYSPVFPTMPEEEVARGFNMMSPYQKILPEAINERKAYMDRCAELGMKVHYNLLSVSGGGGVGSKIEGLSDEEKRSRLIEEIKTFRDHPALLAWYISDEPNANRIPPQKLEEIYRTVKENDPWHPVSIVFTTPFLDSRKYKDAFDIVMADPYPVPNYPITRVEEATGALTKEFKNEKNVWMVIQSFGGGEWWGREPTMQEIRSMTWQAIIRGSCGIQYFVRQGPNYFPKSTSAWNECGRISVEVAELTPWLLSDEESIPVQSPSDKIIVTSRVHDGQLLVLAVNKVNEPVSANISISRTVKNGKALVLFENRSVAITGGVITDHLAPFGSQAYLIDIRALPGVATASKANLIKDPGFEDTSIPGIPAACYARGGGERGATFFLDTREHHEGNHSLRLVTPEQGKSIAIRFFPITAKAGASYSISMWAKSDPEQRTEILQEREQLDMPDTTLISQYAEVSLGELGKARFVPDNEWKRYVTFVTMPADTLRSFKINLILKMPGQGVAWFDQISVTEDK
ncbi:MAG TPA: hypothetical protein PLR88_03220 [Bacteroidales bacterium]|nr:hypothetical protein [Bacteroidales bacterium]